MVPLNERLSKLWVHPRSLSPEALQERMRGENHRSVRHVTGSNLESADLDLERAINVEG